MTTTQTTPGLTGLSNHCKHFIVKTVYKHYYMNIFWREVCQNFSVLLLFITSVIPFSENCDNTLQTVVVCLTGITSLIITFFCDTKPFYETYHLVLDAYKTNYNSPDFNNKYIDLLEHIRDIDIARGKKDFEEYCKASGAIPSPADKLTQNNITEMNRQRYIIMVLSLIAIIGCLLPIIAFDLGVVINLIFGSMIAVIVIGVLFMLVDCDFAPFKKQ